jgi:hypothetical protein
VSGPKTGNFAFFQEIVLSLKQADLRDVFKMNSKCVCASNVVISHDLMSSILLNSSAMKMQENTKEEPDDPEPADKGDITNATLL